MASTPSAKLPDASVVSGWRARFEVELADLDAQALRRRIVTPSSGQGRHIEFDGESLVNFTSNNYLGLSTDPRVITGAVEATERYGASVSAARLLCGSTPLHDELERRLAALKDREACLLYGTGFLANLGVLSTLVGEGDVIISDELNHASIIDGCRISRAGSAIYRHCDLDDLERVLAETEAERRLIVTETVFSMDGDIAPLPALLELAERYDAAVVIDEAHATGVLGHAGSGALSHFGIDPSDLRVPLVVVGTISKALGSSGGFVAADEVIISYLINRSPILHLQHRAPTGRGRRGARRARRHRRGARPAGPRPGARGSAPRGPRGRRILHRALGNPDRPHDARQGRSRPRHGNAAACRRCARARHPPAHGAAGQLPPPLQPLRRPPPRGRAAGPRCGPRRHMSDRTGTYFITGTDTDVGKTVAAAWLASALAPAARVALVKPVQTGTLEPAIRWRRGVLSPPPG